MVYPLSVRIQDIQWPAPCIRGILVSDRDCLANITRGYRLIHRYFGREEPLKVSDSVAVGKGSLLCMAASPGLVAAVDNLLSIGIEY